MESGDPYKLRCSLLGHSQDVRGVGSGRMADGTEMLVSGSRDRSTKVWVPSKEDVGFSQIQSCEGHTNFISCVHVLPPSDKYPTGLVLSGSNDYSVLAFELGKQQPVFRLVGHKNTVCSIDGASDIEIVSGSWDTTAKIWKEQECVATLIGHTASVWAVATIPNVKVSEEGDILTGSADKEIRLWRNRQCAKLYKGHTDCVRTLAVLDATRFLSGSNDASIRLWDVEKGETLEIFYGHSNFIYSIAVMPDHLGFVSVGEDRTLRIWRGDTAAQVLYHPATSVWSVTVMENGDVATGCSDGTVRVFTNCSERMAPLDVLSAFNEEVSKSVVAAQQDLGGMKISELPGPESLFSEGKSDGETKMVRDGDKVGCFSWSASERKWNKVGDVVGASGATQNTSGKVLYEGKEYDYVFSVELEEGQNKGLKLPYNITEDPWFAAQRFIHKNELSQLFLDQVANFIVTNTKGMQVGAAPSNDYADPFTGGNRYVPGTGGGVPSGGSGGGGMDPFTGSGAYTTSQAKASQSSTAINSAIGPCFPVKEFVYFSSPPNYDALKKKLVDFIGSLGQDPLSPEWSRNIELLLDIGRTGKLEETTQQVVFQCLASWPEDKVFPVLDLLRLGVLKAEVAGKLNEKMNVITELPKKFLLKTVPTNQMLSIRLLCNAFGTLTKELMEQRSLIITTMLSNICKGKMNEVAAATLILNYSIVVSRSRANQNLDSSWATKDNQTELLMTAVQMLDQVEDPEAVFRLLAGLGNIISGNSDMCRLLKDLGGNSFLSNFKDVTSAVLPKVKTCCEEIEAVLKTTAVSSSSAGPGSSSHQ